MQQNNPFVPGNKVLSVNAVEFIPQDFRMFSELNRTKPNFAVLEIQKAIKALSDTPEEFYEVIVPLVSILKEHIHSHFVLKAVVQEVFEMSVNTSQFRYSGARMCSYLSQYLVLRVDNGSFLKELVQRCLKEYDSVVTVGGFQTLSHLMGFTLFMGELLVCMKDVEEIRKAFPEKLEDLLMTLTSNQSTHAFRCVIQSLKLTGAILDELVPQAAELYLEIERFVGDSKIPESIQAQIKALLDLRSRGWERDANENEACEGPEQEDNSEQFLCDDSEQEAWPDPVESVYYDPNEGYLIDETEALENMKLTDDDGAAEEGSNVQYLVNGQPMDPETAQDFENFIQQLPSTNQQNEQELLMCGGYFPPDQQWTVDGWSGLPTSFANNPNYSVAGVSDFYGSCQNYDFYPFPESADPNLLQLQPAMQPVIPVSVQQPPLVHQSLGYVQPIQMPGNDRDIYVPVNGTPNGILPPYSHPSFS